MARLYRPHIPLEVRCRVALRQLGTFWPDEAIDARRRTAGGLGAYLSELLDKLAGTLGCETKDLRLDHMPALAIRDKIFRNGIHVDYDPPCDSIDDLIYRTNIAHLVKTNHRGDHGQHPDRVLIKKQRRLERPPKPKRGGKIASKASWPKQTLRGKSKWPKRKTSHVHR